MCKDLRQLNIRRNTRIYLQGLSSEYIMLSPEMEFYLLNTLHPDKIPINAQNFNLPYNSGFSKSDKDLRYVK